MEGDTRRYVRLPEDCVSLCAENLGIQASREVTSSLVEDVSFRIRQTTKLALEFMRHARRKKLCKQDFDKALKWSGIEPLYGLATEPPPFMYVHENGLYCVEDQEMNLLDLALPTTVHPATLPPPPTLSARWLAVEGAAIATDYDGTQSDLPSTVQLKRSPSEAHQKYLSLLLETVTGDSEELRRIALSDILTNPAISNILPDLVQYLLETFSCWVQYSPGQLLRVLRLLSALFKNQHLFLDHYATGLVPLVKNIILTPSYLHTGGTSDHWHVRHMSAMCLAEIVARCDSPLNEYVPAIHASFRHILAQSEVVLQVLYGVVLSLCCMGGKSLAEVLFPHLDPVTNHIQTLLDSSDLAQRSVALRVYDTLLLSSEILLTANISLEVKPEHLSSSFSTTSYLNQGPSSHLTGPNDSSFLSGFTPAGRSIMDTSDLSLGEPQGHVSSLYEFLVELFGERLILRLAKHQRVPQKEKKMEKKMEAQGRGTDAVQQKERPVGHREDPLLQFLKREGFKSSKVQLPLKPVPHKPPAFHPWGRQLWRFHIATALLPVQRNVLEEMGRPRRRALLLPSSRGRMHRRRGRMPQIRDLGSLWL